MPFWRRRTTPHALSGTLLLRVQSSPLVGSGGEPVTLDTDREIDLLAVRTDDGLSAVPAFSSENELLAWDPEGGPFVALDAQAAAALVYANGFDLLVIDPASASTAFARDEISALLDAQ